MNIITPQDLLKPEFLNINNNPIFALEQIKTFIKESTQFSGEFELQEDYLIISQKSNSIKIRFQENVYPKSLELSNGEKSQLLVFRKTKSGVCKFNLTKFKFTVNKVLFHSILPFTNQNDAERFFLEYPPKAQKAVVDKILNKEMTGVISTGRIGWNGGFFSIGNRSMVEGIKYYIKKRRSHNKTQSEIDSLFNELLILNLKENLSDSNRHELEAYQKTKMLA